MEKKSEQLTLFAEDSPANHSVKPGSEEARRMTATSGRKCLGSSKSASPVGLLGRMLLGSSIWNSTARYLTWKAKVTKSGHSYWVLAPSKPRIKDNAAGSSEEKEMWQTPSNNDAGRKGSAEAWKQYAEDGRTTQCRLRNQVQMWPTPRSSEYKGVGLLGSKSHQYRLDKKYLDATVQEAAGVTGQLNAEWVTWLMGYPPGYLTLDPSGT